MATEHLTGLIAAVHTPMRADGSLSLGMVARQARCLTANGVGGAFVCGSTGEGASLSVRERLAVAEQWKAEAEGSLPVLVHAGHDGLNDAREIAAHAEAVVGARAIAAVAPTYFPPTRIADLVAYCARIAAAAPHTPFYYYHFPMRTGLTFKAVDILKAAAAEIPTLAGMKFTHEDLADFRQCLEYDGGRYNLLFGRDELLLSALALGARGAIGSTYNIAAPLYLRILRAFVAGDLETARREQSRAIEMVAVMRRFGPPAVAIKATMRLIGLDCGPSRLPQSPFTDAEYEALRAELTRVGFFGYCMNVERD